MSVSGEYTLDVECEWEHDTTSIRAQQEYGYAKRDRFKGSTRMEAKARAREAGWLLSKNDKAWCPSHADEKRATWR